MIEQFLADARPYMLLFLIGSVHSALIFIVVQAVKRRGTSDTFIAVLPWLLGVPVASVAFMPAAELAFKTELLWPWYVQLAVGLIAGLAASGGARDMHAAWKYVLTTAGSKLKSTLESDTDSKG